MQVSDNCGGIHIAAQDVGHGFARRVLACTAIRYALQHLDMQAVSTTLPAYAALRCPQTVDEPLQRPGGHAIDGKTLRGSVSQSEDCQAAAQVLSAFAIDGPLVLAHAVIEDGDKNHEIPAAEQLIETLGMRAGVHARCVALPKNTRHHP